MKIKFLIISILLSFNLLKAQDGLPVYHDYLTGGWYLVHPSMAGGAYHNQLRVTGRTQWLDVEDAPSTLTASINGRATKNVGLGLIAYGDKNGNYSDNGAYGTFAYHLNLSARETELNQFSFGMSFGIIQSVLDETSFSSSLVALDPTLTGTSTTDEYVNSDFGASYLYKNFFALFSVKNAFKLFAKDSPFAEYDNLRRFVFTTGYTFKINTPIEFKMEPSIQYISTPQIQQDFIDFNGKGYLDITRDLTLWGGLSYRRSFDSIEYSINDTSTQEFTFKSITGFGGALYKDYVFAYTFTNQLGGIPISTLGFHQITLGYNFGGDSRAYDGSRRWDCDCPVGKF